MQILPAEKCDAKMLTDLCIASKRIWNYPPEYFQIWEDELTITPNKIESQPIFKGICKNSLVGMYSLIEWEQSFYLEHIFIDPAWIRHGFGSKLIYHALETSKSLGYKTLNVLVDPNARGFYDKLGAIWVKDIPSNIPGRMIPYYQFQF